jgi:hypothetical protein
MSGRSDEDSLLKRKVIEILKKNTLVYYYFLNGNQTIVTTQVGTERFIIT